MVPVRSVRSGDDVMESWTWFIPVLLTMAGFATYVIVREWGGPESGGLWVMVPFDLACLYMLWLAGRYVLHRQKYGQLTLELDPAPGSVGGQVGGSVTVPLRPSRDDRYRVMVACIQSVVSEETLSETGERTVVWQRSVEPDVASAPGGVEIRFAADVPDDLPESEEPSGRYHFWQVRVLGDLPGLDLNARFVVPVKRMEEPLESSFSPRDASEPQSPSLPPEVVEMDRHEGEKGEEVELHFLAGRARRGAFRLLSAAWVLALLGVASLLVALDVWDDDLVLDQGDVFFYYPALVLLGGALLVWISYLRHAWGTVHVHLRPDWITWRRTFLGRTRRRTLHRRQVHAWAVKANFSTKYQVYDDIVLYELSVIPMDGRRRLVVDGLLGTKTLDPVLDLLEEWSGAPVIRR